jgi:hypothetical protein
MNHKLYGQEPEPAVSIACCPPGQRCLRRDDNQTVSRTVKSAVWSFWTPPRNRDARWRNDLDHLLSWSLSLATAARFFESTTLVTDSTGARLLVDKLHLPFDEVSTSLDLLNEKLSAWWVLGKLAAYAQQDRPFVHIDSDVYLWKGLPASLLKANMIGQNPERAPLDESSYYKPKTVMKTVERHGGRLPGEFADYVRNHGDNAINTGIFGGCAWEEIRDYSRNALEMITTPANARPWEILGELFMHSVLVEQYYLAAYCAELDRTGRFEKPSIEYLFNSEEAAFRDSVATRAGYTHLMGAKRNPHLMGLVAGRLRRDFNHQYEACLRAVESTQLMPAGRDRNEEFPLTFIYDGDKFAGRRLQATASPYFQQANYNYGAAIGASLLDHRIR